MYTFIVNPHARSGMGQKVWDELEKILKERQVPYLVHYTKYQKHATALTSEITSDNEEHTLVILGGDGTVNEVVNGIENFEKTTLGYIPIGSGNDFARGMGIQKDPRAALERVLESAKISSVNVGELSYGEKKRRFAVSSGIGYDAAICHEAMVSPIKVALNKLKLGKLTYILIALHRLIVTTPCECTISFDEGKPVTFPNTYFVAMMNNKYEGGGVKFCPRAKNDDDKLDILVGSDLPKWKILLLLPLALFGLHTHFKGVHIYTCSQADVTTQKALAVHTDGEPIPLKKQVSVRCLPQRLNVIK